MRQNLASIGQEQQHRVGAFCVSKISIQGIIYILGGVAIFEMRIENVLEIAHLK